MMAKGGQRSSDSAQVPRSAASVGRERGGMIVGSGPARSSTDTTRFANQDKVQASASSQQRPATAGRPADLSQVRTQTALPTQPSALSQSSQAVNPSAGQHTLLRPTPADESAPVVIALDVDEVLVCYVDGFRKFLQRERPDGPCDIDTAFHEAHHPRSPWRLQFAMSGGLDNLEAVPGAAAALRKLRAAGIRLEAVTSRPPIMRQSTEALLLRLFPPDTFSAAHFAGPGEKGHTCNMIKAQALVDDQLPNIIDATSCGVVGVLFDLCRSYPWCRHIRLEDLPSGSTCMETWANAADYLLSIFEPQLEQHRRKLALTGQQQPSSAALGLETRQVLPARSSAQASLGPPGKAPLPTTAQSQQAQQPATTMLDREKGRTNAGSAPTQEPLRWSELPSEQGGLGGNAGNSMSFHSSAPAEARQVTLQQSAGTAELPSAWRQSAPGVSAIEESSMDHAISFDPRRAESRRYEEASIGREAQLGTRFDGHNYAHPSTIAPRLGNEYLRQEEPVMDVRGAPTTLLSSDVDYDRRYIGGYGAPAPERKADPVATTPLGGNLLAGVGGLFSPDMESSMDARSRDGTDSQGCVVS